MKKKSIIISLLIILLAVVVGVMLIVKSRVKPSSADESIASQRYIVHAGGFIECNGEEMDYTNTYETLDNLYNMGNRVAEYDFQSTSDGCIVCAHDGDDGLWARGYDFEQAPTLEEFLGSKYKGQLTTMSLEMLAEYMYAHKDFYVVTDVKDDLVAFCQHLNDTYPALKDRFIIQIYHDDQYAPVHDMGFNNIIYTLYNTYDEERDPARIYSFLTEHELVGVTFWDFWAVPGDALFEALRSSNVPMYVHTVNSPDSMKEFFDLGITAIYTDVVDPALRY